MIAKHLLSCALLPLLNTFGGEVKIESKDGRTITAHLVELTDKSARVVRSDGTDTTIPLSAIADKSVAALKIEAAKPPGLEFNTIQIGMTKAQVKTLAPQIGLDLKFPDIKSDEFTAEYSEFLSKKFKQAGGITTAGTTIAGAVFRFRDGKLALLEIKGKESTGIQEPSIVEALRWADQMYSALREKYGEPTDKLSEAGKLAEEKDYGELLRYTDTPIAMWEPNGGGVVSLECKISAGAISKRTPSFLLVGQDYIGSGAPKPKF